MLPRLNPIATKERVSMIFVEYGQSDVFDEQVPLKVVTGTCRKQALAVSGHKD